MEISIRDGTIFAADSPTLLDGLTSLGLRSVEIAINREGRVTAPNTAKGQPAIPPLECRQQLDRTGIQSCAVLMANDFTMPAMDAEIHWVIQGAAAAKALGAPVVRVDAYMRNALDWTPEKRIARFAECMKEVLASSEARGMDFGIENHGPLGNDPQFIEAVLEAVGDSRLGLTMDTGNLYWSGKPLEEVHRILERFAGRTKHTHVKNIAYPAETRNQPREIGWKYGEYCCALADGDIDLARVALSLKAAGYNRTLCIENESLGRYSIAERLNILRRDADHLRQILA